MFSLPFITICWAFLLAHSFIIRSSNGLEPELNTLIEKNFNVKFSLQPRADILTAPKYKFTYTRGVRIPGKMRKKSSSWSFLLSELLFYKKKYKYIMNKNMSFRRSSCCISVWESPMAGGTKCNTESNIPKSWCWI